jgi:glycerophosphoryl diester phosphodiesterase
MKMKKKTEGRGGFVLALLLTTSLTLHAVEIIGHRGASHDAPENTLASFRLAFEQKADAAELDTRLTKDGQAVVIHDANTQRTTGTAGVVKDLTLAELRALDAGAWKGERWRGEKLPTLAEALATIPVGRRLFIEIKCGPEILPELVRVVQASGKQPTQMPIISFNYETVKQAKALLPDHEICFLASAKTDQNTGQPPSIDDLIARTRAAKLDGLDLDHQFPIDDAFVGKVHAAGLKLYVWTVNDAAIAQRLAAAGVDGITTDRPGALRDELGKRPALPSFP